jgi:hypothetical protein
LVNIVLDPGYDLARRLAELERRVNGYAMNPVLNSSAGTSQTNFAVLNSASSFGVQSATVPEGYATCLVFNGVSGGSYNNTAGAGYLYVSSIINGGAGGETPVYVPASTYGSTSAFGVRTLTDLVAGDTITVGTQMRTSTASWASSSSSIANTNALFFFFR